MGAVTALRYAASDQRISCILSDSPFSDLKKLALDFAKDNSKVPGFLVKGALSFVKRSIKKRAKFNIKDLDQTKLALKCLMPAIFVTSKEDRFVKPWHTEKLYDLYSGEKKLVYVKGDHNSVRPKEFFIDCVKFFKENLVLKHVNVHLGKDKSSVNNEKMKFEPEEAKKNKINMVESFGIQDLEKSDKMRHSSIERKSKNDPKIKENDDSEEEDSSNERGKSAEHEKNMRKSKNVTQSLKLHFSKLKKINNLDLDFDNFHNEKPKWKYSLYKDPFKERNDIILKKK